MHEKIKTINKFLAAMKDYETDCSFDKILEEVKIHHKFFDEDALIIDERQSDSVTLLRAADDHKVKVSFDAPLFGVWSPDTKNAPFVCIEPWNGRCDRVGYSGSLEEREHGNTLSQDGVFTSTFSIEIK